MFRSLSFRPRAVAVPCHFGWRRKPESRNLAPQGAASVLVLSSCCWRGGSVRLRLVPALGMTGSGLGVLASMFGLAMFARSLRCCCCEQCCAVCLFFVRDTPGLLLVFLVMAWFSACFRGFTRLWGGGILLMLTGVSRARGRPMRAASGGCLPFPPTGGGKACRFLGVVGRRNRLKELNRK